LKTLQQVQKNFKALKSIYTISRRYPPWQPLTFESALARLQASLRNVTDRFNRAGDTLKATTTLEELFDVPYRQQRLPVGMSQYFEPIVQVHANSGSILEDVQDLISSTQELSRLEWDVREAMSMIKDALDRIRAMLDQIEAFTANVQQRHHGQKVLIARAVARDLYEAMRNRKAIIEMRRIGFAEELDQVACQLLANKAEFCRLSMMAVTLEELLEELDSLGEKRLDANAPVPS
jgi:hypothetical protein